MSATEQWKDIIGYEGLYQISSYGRVKSLPRKGCKGQIVKPSFTNSGYQQTHLCKNGKAVTKMVHRIVAIHFIYNPDNLPEVNHINECKTDNRVENLEWCTRLQNVRHGTGVKRMAKAHNYKESAIKSAQNHDYKAIARKRAKPVLQYSKDGKFIKRWDSLRDITRELGYSCGNLSGACNGKFKYRYGYAWKFEENA